MHASTRIKELFLLVLKLKVFDLFMNAPLLTSLTANLTGKLFKPVLSERHFGHIHLSLGGGLCLRISSLLWFHD